MRDRVPLFGRMTQDPSDGGYRTARLAMFWSRSGDQGCGVVSMPIRKFSSRAGVFAVVSLAAATLAACSSSSSSTSGRVLLVGSYHGVSGQYRTIQAAVDAAKPGDWVLVAPGDYHETDDHQHPPTSAQAKSGEMAGVLIKTSDIHLRGMNRGTVVVDGTKVGAPQCSSVPTDQDLGTVGADGKAVGRNGIVVYKADGVTIDNLSTCNFLNGTGSAGNGIWWDGGSGSGTIGLHGYSGSYLTATSTYYGPVSEDATYGIFANSAVGPATWNQIYASNFNDSGMYVGACRQSCNVTINHAWMEYNALGYSGTNAGGAIVIENSQFDNNQDGFDTNTQILGDPPPPQNGQCPGDATSDITHTHSCWAFIHNNVHDNNNPNVPQAPGYASAGPTGTGMTISGGRNDTVMNNTFSNNGAWGVLFVPFPDSDTPFPGVTCANSGGTEMSGLGCVYEAEGNALLHNTFIHNGFFGNPSNSDFGQVVINAGKPRNCFAGNSAPDGSAPPNLEALQPTCGPVMAAPNTGGALLGQVLCDTGFGSCPAGSHYPKVTGVTMQPLPGNLPTMPNPCAGVPSNPWCGSTAALGPDHHRTSRSAAASSHQVATGSYAVGIFGYESRRSAMASAS